MALVDDVKSVVQGKLTALKIAIPTNVDDILEEVQYAILNYCNIDEVPAMLKFTWANMSTDYLRWQTETAVKDETAEEGVPGSGSSATYVSSIKEGNTSVSFSVDSTAENASSKNAHKLAGVLDGIVLNYKDALNRFRRVEW